MDFDTYAIGGTAPERTVDYEVHKHILALDDSLGPIELGDGATVLRRHLLIFYVVRETGRVVEGEVKCFLGTHLP